MTDVLLGIIALLLFRIWLDMPHRTLWETTMRSMAKSLADIAGMVTQD